MKIYVASSWRNEQQPIVVAELRMRGHAVYDFKREGFSWSEVDPAWQQWPANVDRYLAGLRHPAAARGFARDMKALKLCDACVMVQPCGSSASMEMGYCVGAGKPTAVYVPAIREPELMMCMAPLVTSDWAAVVAYLASRPKSSAEACGCDSGERWVCHSHREIFA